jgi:hypothetical protein
MLTRGQIVPNMSSLLFRSSALNFRVLAPIKNFKLAGDWFFVILLQVKGAGYFISEELNYFRSHDKTARVKTDAQPRAAEYFLCNYTAWSNSTFRKSISFTLQDTLTMAKVDKVSLVGLTKGLMKLSKKATLKILFSLTQEFLSNPSFFVGRVQRYIRMDGNR